MEIFFALTQLYTSDLILEFEKKPYIHRQNLYMVIHYVILTCRYTNKSRIQVNTTKNTDTQNQMYMQNIRLTAHTISIIQMYKMCYLKCMNECNSMFCVSVFLVVLTCNLLLLVYLHVNIT
jgi:hypothetical protein